MEPDQPTKRSNFLSISILAAALIIGGSLIYSAGLKGGGGAPPVAQVAGNEAASNNNPGIDDDVILGDPNAPVTLIEWGDYQCPFCLKMFEETEVKLREDYVKTGKLKMVYRDFPLDQLHPFARRAAEAAECARDAEKYWAYHDLLFNRQEEIPSMDFVAVAEELRLDTAQFKQCFDSRKYQDEVQKDYDDGIAAGVTGTPGNFIISGNFSRFLAGALPYQAFKAAIEEALQSSLN